ncbi:MAG TPA: PAS domain S-box protein [Gaiellaceae bacterium]|nr:PAS domain S-box protein [Gaiellaceae bacterium]
MRQEARDFGLVSYTDDRLVERRFTLSASPLGPDAAVILFEPVTEGAGSGVSEFEAIVKSAEDAILSKSLDGTILSWNHSAERIYGYTAAEAIGQSVSILLPPERSTEVTEILDRLRRGERIGQLETVRVRKDGTRIDVSLTVSPIIDTRGAVVGATSIARDMRSQKEAEARIHLLAEIVEASADAILSRDLDGIVTSWNAGAERLFGYTAEEMVGSHIDLLTGEMSPDLRELREKMNRGAEQGPIDLIMRRKDGSEVAVSSAGSPITDPSGALVGVAVVIRDVSERQQLEEKLRQAQKLEAVGSLAGGIAHDFNNLLLVIRAAAAIARSHSVDTTAHEKLAQIDQAAEHASSLTTQLLAFSRQQVLQPEPTDLNSIVETTLGLLERLIGEGIQVSRRSSPDLQPVLVDRNQLQQVIMNLGINARDAMPDGGKLIVQTSAAVLDEDYAAVRADVTAGDYALLEITDTGTGIAPESQGRIFDPFFTTKATGTGLGLATVYGIVKQSRGHIALYSELGLGTTFKIYLPYANRKITKAGAAATSETVAGTETILLVDDNELVRPLIHEVLENYGYTVFSAASGIEALAIAEERGGKIDLLLTDVVMPGMTGGALAEALVASHPDLVVLFTSGFPADTVLRHGIEEGRVSFIQKPFLGNDLTLKIRSLLDQAK